MNGEGCACVMMLYEFHNSHATTLISGKEICFLICSFIAISKLQSVDIVSLRFYYSLYQYFEIVYIFILSSSILTKDLVNLLNVFFTSIKYLFLFI